MIWLQKWAMRQKGVLVGNAIFSICIGLAIIAQSYAIVQIVNEVFIKKSAFSATFPYIAVLIGAIIIRVICTSVNRQLGVRLSTNVKKRVRQSLLKKWQQDPLQISVKGQIGSKVTMLIEMIDQLESYYRDYVPQVIQSMLVPFILLIAVFMTHIYSGLILLCTAPLIPVAYIIVGLQTQKKSERQLKELTFFSGKFLDLVQGLQTLKLFGQGKQQREELAENNRAFQTSTMSILKVAFASTFFIELVVTLGIGLVAIEIAYQMITFETMTFAPAFFILAIAPEFYNAIKDLGSAFHSGRGSMAAAEILEEELERPIEPVKWGTQPLEQQPSIEIKQGAFQYGDAFKLEQLNVKVPPNSRTAIVGPTGQGKTTLLNILAGVYELTEGHVKIDGKLRQEVSKDAWFEQIAYISQHPYLFTGTIAENIQMKKGACDEVAIQRAIEQAQLGDWIATLPNGMHTAVGEAGRGMSGGEKQRLAIARAFYKQCTIVFFDEPTMGLDVQTEQLLQRVMDELAQTRTVITVAHRLHTIQQADQILLVHNGTIEQTGTHQELLQKSAIYREMVGGERHEGTC